MGIVFLIGLGLLFFVIGISLIYRGITESPDAEAVVAKDEFDLVSGKLNLAQKQEDGLKLQLDSLAVELQAAKTQVEGTERIRKDVDFLRVRDREHQDMIRQLEDNLNFLARKADIQAKKAIDAITELNRRNQALASELEAQSDKVSDQDVDALKREKEDLEQKIQQNQSQIESLQAELKNAQQRSAADMTEAAALIEKLRSENKAFEDGVSQITGRISTVEEEFMRSQMEKDRQLAEAMDLIERLRKEQALLKQQGRSPEDTASLEIELNRIKAESEGRLAEAHQNIGRLQEEVERLQREIQTNQSQREQLQHQIDENSQMSGDGQEDAKQQGGHQYKQERLWEQEKQGIEQELSELREANQFLRQKERLLSQELLRSQTQALGLEKICQEFKKRIERQ